MQNTFSQSGNDSKWFLKKSFFKIGMWHSRPPRDPPPLHGKNHLKFPFWFFEPFPKQAHKPSKQISQIWKLTNTNVSETVTVVPWANYLHFYEQQVKDSWKTFWKCHFSGKDPLLIIIHSQILFWVIILFEISIWFCSVVLVLHSFVPVHSRLMWPRTDLFKQYMAQLERHL